MGCVASKFASKVPLLPSLVMAAAPQAPPAAATPLAALLGSYLGGACRRVVVLDGEFQSFELAPEHQGAFIWNDFHGPAKPGAPGPFSFMREIGVLTFAAVEGAGAAPSSFALQSAVTRHLPLLFDYRQPAAPFDNPEAFNQTFACVSEETRKVLGAAFDGINLQVRACVRAHSRRSNGIPAADHPELRLSHKRVRGFGGVKQVAGGRRHCLRWQ